MARRRRLKTVLEDANRDLISELPIEVKDRILECLPTRDAARMALLSRHWNDAWLQHGQLVFDSDFWCSAEQCYDDEEDITLVNIINNILFLRAWPVKKFTLEIDSAYDPWPQQTDFDKWTIKQLIVRGSFINLPVNACDIFSNVTSLEFLHVEFKRGVNGIASSISIPKLEKLAFKLCSGVNKFEISTPKLEILYVIHSMDDVVDSRWLAPHFKAIKTLWLCDSSLECMDTSMFPTAINLQVMMLYGLNFCCRKQLAVVMQFLKKCPNLCELRISTDEFGSEDDKEDASRLLEDPDSFFVIHELKMLNTIKIKSYRESTLELIFIIMFLSKSPALERFIVKFWGTNAPVVR
ncbi:PREDICTED: F-box/LRR-repeat protein At4g14103-like [Ipomoea nil]|uniref:F-box/LRR-repeat protein At4g14103-like n=1 Tax=Ipomoea nil TaxID=35883 RepID=UPI0009015A51|nr:PREDICTED: F-box/LRR-repeat protein At4g14103-like [Ipomoea nil]